MRDRLVCLNAAPRLRVDVLAAAAQAANASNATTDPDSGLGADPGADDDTRTQWAFQSDAYGTYLAELRAR
eukprot:3935623-Rhodomonas_salina.1